MKATFSSRSRIHMQTLQASIEYYFQEMNRFGRVSYNSLRISGL